MRTIYLLATAVSLSAADLGYITPTTGIHIESGRDANLVNLHIEFYPQQPPTNVVTIVKTNTLLTIADLTNLPPGRVIMGIKSYHADGSESDVSLYSFELRRHKPAPPVAKAVGIMSVPMTIHTNVSFTPKQSAILTALQSRPRPTIPPPLPGTNVTYSESLERRMDSRKRRGE